MVNQPNFTRFRYFRWMAKTISGWFNFMYSYVPGETDFKNITFAS